MAVFASGVLMSIRSLRTLVAVAEQGSFAAAAPVLGLTPSAVSLQMRSLEAELRTRLFDRTRRSPTLNGAGRALLDRAREIVLLYDEMGTIVSPADDLGGGLVLGAVHTMLTGLLPDVLLALKADHPRVQVRVIGGLSAELTAQVDRGELDAALVTEPTGRLPAGLEWKICSSEPLMVIAPLDAAEGGERELLEGHPFIRFNRRAWAGRLIDDSLRQRGIKIVEAMELDSLEAISLMVSKGLGVSVVPQRPITAPFRLPLRIVAFGDPPLHRRVGLVERLQHNRSRLTEALLRRFRRLAAETGLAETGPRG
jgi:DNA-binding transcriptional LysR family regulator